MSKYKRISAVLLVAAIACTLCGCGQKIPDSRSEDWGLYVRESNGDKFVVDDIGKKAAGYAFDKKGNIIDADKTIIIGADNCATFIYTQSVYAKDESVFHVELDSQITETSSGSLTGSPVRSVDPIEKTVRVTLDTKPADATCSTYSISSDNPNLVELVAARDDTKDEQTGTLTCNPVGGEIVFDFIAKDEGAANINIESLDGGSGINYSVSISVSETPINADEFEEKQPEPEDFSNEIDTNPVSGTASAIVAAEDDIPTTENTPGWITGTKANVREKTSTSSTILGTYPNGTALTILGSESGWTKVNIDGQTGYVKSVYVTDVNPNPGTEDKTAPGAENTDTPSGQSSGNQQNPSSGGTGSGQSASSGSPKPTPTPGPVNAPIAANDGYSHGFATSQAASPKGEATHVHDFKLTDVVEATETTKGYSVYQCSCGAMFTSDYTSSDPSSDTHIHSYSEDVISPTCTDMGFTNHVCSCGAEYRDNFVNAFGHSFGDGEEIDSENHIFQYTCIECGYTYTAEQ